MYDAQRNCSAIYCNLWYYNANNPTIWALCPTSVLTPAMKVMVDPADPSMEQPTTNLISEVNQQMHMYNICFITRY